MLQNCHTRTRSTGCVRITSSKEFTYISIAKAINIFAGSNGCTNCSFVNMLRHRHHWQNTGNISVAIYFFDKANHFFFRSICGEKELFSFAAKFFHQLHQTIFINMGSRVITYNENRQSCKASTFFCSLNFFSDKLSVFVSDGFTAHDNSFHKNLP